MHRSPSSSAVCRLLGAAAFIWLPRCLRIIPITAITTLVTAAGPEFSPARLRCEYLEAPNSVETPAPRLSWEIVSARRGAAQSAWQIQVASTADRLAAGEADLWDSGRVGDERGRETNQIAYAGRPLASRTQCHWRVRVWDENGRETAWTPPARWAMGLLHPDDWTAQWISYRDREPLHQDRKKLFLPPARTFRRDFQTREGITRATAYVSALGLYDLHCNGSRVGDVYFLPGWSDYRQRAYYRTHDITTQVRAGGPNAIGAVLSDGWYAGYVGYGLMVGYGPNKVGRFFYGRTPALLMQVEIEYADGTRETIRSGPDWQVTDRGPTREADLIMGETHDARLELGAWSSPGYDATGWESAVLAETNPNDRAIFHEGTGPREVQLGFVRPAKLSAYPAPPVRVTQELPVRAITEPKAGAYIFDLGQNFAGIVRLRVRGAAGTTVQLRYGERLHADGTLMIENLRKARATDTYILRGSDGGEVWSPRFTYHGFQYVEVTGLPERPALDTITGLVLQNDTPPAGGFECSDPVLTQFARNAEWTQRSNFVEVPTDCPQRDERLGWLGDAQVYIRTATFNADVAAFFTKWADDVVEAQRSFGAYPDYAPYPMAHGGARKTFGSGWTDAGIICPWTLWRVYGERRLLERQWDSMTRFMQWRHAGTTSEGLGASLGNPWGDWLNLNEKTPVEFIDTCYYALDCALMAEMADALGRTTEAAFYTANRARTAAAFARHYVRPDGSLTVDTQTAYVLALANDLIPPGQVAPAAARLKEKIEQNGNRMATGFLGTRALLPVLTKTGHHNLAVRLFQSRRFPSWGYEVVNGANSVWERWDSYTKEHGFNGANGKQNAGMNSFNHYAFGAVMEWAYRELAGIDTDGPGYRRIIIRPRPPAPGSNPDETPIDWVRAHYDSINGRISVAWRRAENQWLLDITIPANTEAEVHLPTATPERALESGQPLRIGRGIRAFRTDGDDVVVEVGSGRYAFAIGPGLKTE